MKTNKYITMDSDFDFTNAEMLRKTALKRLEEKKADLKAAVEEGDAMKLLHELQVHQIELEMQNEELMRAYDKTEKALKKYTMLFDLSPMGYFTLEADSTIADLNFAGARMLGDRRFSLINSNFKLYLSQESLPVFNNFVKRMYNSSAKESCQLVLGYDSEVLCVVYAEGVVVDNNKQCLLSLVDISDFKEK
jgi:PAS domain-containing protein